MRKPIDYFNAIIDAVADEIVSKQKHEKPLKKETVNITTYIPRNSIESAIRSLALTAKESHSDSYRYSYCEDILKIVKTNWTAISDFDKSYAIAWLKTTICYMHSDSYRREIGNMIVKIATGNLN